MEKRFVFSIGELAVDLLLEQLRALRTINVVYPNEVRPHVVILDERDDAGKPLLPVTIFDKVDLCNRSC